MGMTPLEGLMMGTRSGNIDPAIIPYLMNHEKLDADQINDLLNKQS
jgi:acetate kinase